MSNDLLIQGNGPMELPAHLAGQNFGVTTNLMEGMFTTGNRIGLKGSRFRLIVAGIEECVIQEPYLDVIFLGAAPAVSRVYFEGSYKQGENAAPTCYSADGVAPADDVKAKQSDKCMTCPQNAKGSKIVDGQQYKACGYFRRVVVMLAGDTDQRTVFKLDVKSGGLFGEGTVNEKNLNDYIKMIATRGVDAGAVVTRVSFDTESSVPKLLFKAVRFISVEEMDVVSDLVQSDEVLNLKTVTMSTLDVSHETPTGGDEEPEAAAPAETTTQRTAPAASQRPAQTAQRPAAAPQAAPATQRPAPATQRTAAAPAPAPATSQRPAQTTQRPAATTQRPAATSQRAANTVVQDNVPAPQRTAAAKPQQEPVVQEVGTDDEFADLLASLE
jgi:hypothetical protein